MVAMSGGVDSSVAAALLMDAGHEVVGVTMKLWGGPSDTGCCAVSDVDDARRSRSASNTTSSISARTSNATSSSPMSPTTPPDGHPIPVSSATDTSSSTSASGRCARVRHDRHRTSCRVVSTPAGPRLGRGVDAAKDQSYVLHVIEESVLARMLLPVVNSPRRRSAASLWTSTCAPPRSPRVRTSASSPTSTASGVPWSAHSAETRGRRPFRRAGRSGRLR